MVLEDMIDLSKTPEGWLNYMPNIPLSIVNEDKSKIDFVSDLIFAYSHSSVPVIPGSITVPMAYVEKREDIAKHLSSTSAREHFGVYKIKNACLPGAYELNMSDTKVRKILLRRATLQLILNNLDESKVIETESLNNLIRYEQKRIQSLN